MIDLEEYIAENNLRNRELEIVENGYDPLSGHGCCGERVSCGDAMLPVSLLHEHPHYLTLDGQSRDVLRIAHDFEYWCARCVTVKDKSSGRLVPLILNRGQRKLLAAMERQRAAGAPIRIILLKARQWGGSTLTQMYMAWIQIVHRKGWNSIILSHQLTGTLAIKRMLANLVDNYPVELLDGGKSLTMRSAGSPNVLDLHPRGCTVVLGSSRSEDAVRGTDLAMAHLSEVAFWKDTGEDVVRSVGGAIARLPLTVIVMESTANGYDKVFHSQWQRAVAGESDKSAVFVPWYEIPLYRREVSEPAKLIAEMDDYEHDLWARGLTLEMIAWYHDKRREYGKHRSMQAEYPTTPEEAFGTSGDMKRERVPLPADLSELVPATDAAMV